MSDTDLHGSDITRYEAVEAEESGTQWTDVPFVSRYTATADAVKQAGGEGALSTAFSIGGEIKGLGDDVMGVLTDPIGTLVGAGLTIVLDLVQPFDDLLMMVSGDATEMQRQIDVLGQVEAALEALDGEIANAADANMTTWDGEAAAAAGNAIGGLAATAGSMSQRAKDVAALLDWARMLAETIYEVIKAVLTELVTWAVTRGIVALAASVPTAGASVAAFLMDAVVSASRMLLKATRKFQFAQQIFMKLLKFLRANPVVDRAAGEYRLWKELLSTAGAAVVDSAKGAAADVYGHVADAGGDAPSISTMVGDATRWQVEPDELEAAAAALDDLAPNAEAIATAAGEAGTAEMTWGLPGLFFAEAFTEGCAELANLTGLLGASIGRHADGLRRCAETYAQTDADIAAEFERLAAETAG
ncbi:MULTISPECIES: hypothetical protein [Glycomyces]|uniref:WXG100 family type VII secretion target n=2 Tax=Glycomyces TaxID=58113 RepID=A0A9X3T9C8_9ACTN|nr:hypothetical protein [Glycomyces lechevalierae]MDA1386338.1 hypothetical protein [Glycomyces lechevalierae]MDR7338853.1 hypothetical protein [Glycomyces lechevalierae]